jgi:hypothetical protein
VEAGRQHDGRAQARQFERGLPAHAIADGRERQPRRGLASASSPATRRAR